MSIKMTIACFIISLIIALVPQILWLVGQIICRMFRHTLPYAPFGWTSLILLVLVLAIQTYGTWIGRYQLETTHEEYASSRLPDTFDGYKVVHISDLHLGTFLSKPSALQRAVDSINAQQPDLICITGDLVGISLDELDSLKPIISQLKARDGVMSVLGNHDLFIYGRHSEEERTLLQESLAEKQRSLGWNLLRNEHAVLHRGNDSITIVGVDNFHGGGQGFQTLNLGDLAKAMTGVSDKEFTLLLSHDPSHWEAEVLNRTSIDLTLSGHTHAAQIRLFGWSPASWMFHHVQGRYDIGSQTLYVNRGIGCTAPMRIGCPAEITVFTLKHKNK